MTRILLVMVAVGSLAALMSFGRGFQDVSPQVSGAGGGADSGTSGARPIFKGADRISADGVVEGARPESSLRTEIAGTLATIYVKEGQTVKRGDLLAELRNDSQKIQIALATAEMNQARARLTKLRNGERAEKRKALAAIVEAKVAAYRQAKGALERTQRLWDQHSISRDEYDRDFFTTERSKAEMEEASAEHSMVEAPARVDEVTEHEALVLAAQAKLQLAQAELAKTRMLAPSSGKVLRIFAEPGEVAGPATEQPVLLLADLSKLRVRAFVEELDANRVKLGQDATITADGLPGKHLAGKVTQIAPRMGRRSPQTDAPGEYKDLYYREVLIEPEGADGLPLNFRVLTRIRVEN